MRQKKVFVIAPLRFIAVVRVAMRCDTMPCHAMPCDAMTEKPRRCLARRRCDAIVKGEKGPYKKLTPLDRWSLRRINQKEAFAVLRRGGRCDAGTLGALGGADRTVKPPPSQTSDQGGARGLSESRL